MDRGLQAFAQWQDGGSFSLLAFCAGVVALSVVVMPVLTLAHELGHAAVALLRTAGLVTVRVGRTPAVWRGRIGRLVLELSPVPARGGPRGRATVHARLGRGERVAFALAGPLAHAAAATGVVLVGVHTGHTVITYVGAIGLLGAVLNLVPKPGRDGAAVLAALRSHGASPAPLVGTTAEPFARRLDDTFSRWLVLFTDERSSTKTPRRAGLLAACADEPAAVGSVLFGLAYAGWCWREVEDGDAPGTREAALDAVHAATRSGAYEPHLTILAARRLAEHGLDDDRARFLTGALARIRAGMPSGGLTVEQQRAAFGYGVALHDVERVRGSLRDAA